MTTLEDPPEKTLSVTNFKAHCTEELRLLEKTGQRIAITRRGKTIAYVEPAGSPKKSVGELIGSLEGTVKFADDYDEDTPAIPFEDWEMHEESSKD